MTKENLITKIRSAFKNVKLEDGIGLWEAQGLDDYADQKTILKLKAKDKREDWDTISYQELALCESSLSFLDAKGMRFCLPKFLIFDILEDEILEKEGINSPEVLFTLSFNFDEEYQKKRFSLFDKAQIECIIAYLKYKLELNYDEIDFEEIDFEETIQNWEQQLN